MESLFLLMTAAFHKSTSVAVAAVAVEHIPRDESLPKDDVGDVVVVDDDA